MIDGPFEPRSGLGVLRLANRYELITHSRRTNEVRHDQSKSIYGRLIEGTV